MILFSRPVHLVFVVFIAACGSSSSGDPGDAGGRRGDSGGSVGPAAQGALSLYLTTKSDVPGTFCAPVTHWINVPFAASGGQHTTATNKGALAIDGEGGMAVSCKIESAGPKFAVSATLKSPATDSTGGALNPVLVSLATTIGPDESGATGHVGILDDKTATEYLGDPCSFSVHPMVNGDQLGIAAGHAWASVTCPTIRDPLSNDTQAVCQIATGYFLLENCL